MIIFFFAIASLFSAQPKLKRYYPDYNKPQSEYLYLLTEPRSGTHWLQASIQYLTNRRVLPFEQARIYSHSLPMFGMNILEVPIDKGKKPIFRTHCEKNMVKTIGNVTTFSKGNKLIFLTRNYKEIFARHMGTRCQPNFEIATKKLRFILVDYLKKIAFFDRWDTNNRLFLYYEDMITSPEKVFTQVAKFVDADQTQLKLYFQEYDDNRKKSFSFYQKHVVSGAKSTGNETKFHSLKLTGPQRKRLDQIIWDTNPKIADRYLRRYL